MNHPLSLGVKVLTSPVSNVDRMALEHSGPHTDSRADGEMFQGRKERDAEGRGRCLEHPKEFLMFAQPLGSAVVKNPW
jgi:hypothetical protein